MPFYDFGTVAAGNPLSKPSPEYDSPGTLRHSCANGQFCPLALPLVNRGQLPNFKNSSLAWRIIPPEKRLPQERISTTVT